jgi:hypothetical protein
MKTLPDGWLVYEIFLFGIWLTAGFVLCPFILYGLSIYAGKPDSLLDILNMLVFNKGLFNPKEIMLIVGIVFIPYFIYLLTKINFLGILKSLKKVISVNN